MVHVTETFKLLALLIKVLQWSVHINSLLSKVCDTGNFHQTIIALSGARIHWKQSDCRLSCLVRFEHKPTLCLQKTSRLIDEMLTNRRVCFQ